MTLETPTTLAPAKVPLRSGPPTKDEMNVYYPGKFTWDEMKTFVNSGDLGLLKRDKALQRRYMEWSVGIKNEYGSMVNYLLDFRLQWGKPDTLCLLPSALDVKIDCTPSSSISPDRHLSLPSDAPPYFTANTPPEYISIIMNDWPYSVPSEVEHSLIWTRLPIFHPNIINNLVAARIAQDGIWGFTGNISPPPSPSNLPLCLPALSDWGVTREQMIVSQKGTAEEEALVARAGAEVHEFVKKRWLESEWETAWFVNPPRLQSVPGLAHVHVFAKRKI